MSVPKTQGPDAVGLEILLQLEGEVFPMDNGFWTKFEVRKVEANEHIPHVIKYSLTLHDRNNVRVFGLITPTSSSQRGRNLVLKR